MNDADMPTTSSVVWAVEWSGVKLKDRYRIEKELGRGGFGVVYLARDEQLHDRPVVVKVLLEHRSEQSAWFSKKFHQEREALARLDHPGVVGVLDAGETPDGRPFLVMQFVDGITLRAAMRAGSLPLERAAHLIKQIGAALTAAHERGVYHRDLKPENIMLQDLGGGEEQVKIIDFGIATVKEAQAATQVEQTRVAGSGPYMAPEQLMGKPAPGSDIYALGIITYEMVTGQRPFNPESLAHMYLLQQQGVKTPPTTLRPELPAAAEVSILKALMADLEQRYQRAREFGDDFARAVAGGPAPAVVAPPQPAPRSRRTVLPAIAAVVVVVAASALFWVRGRSGGAERSFHYSIQVQRYREGKPLSQPFVLAGEMLFQADYRIRLQIASAQAGHLYLVNEGPVSSGGLPSYNMVYPGAGEPAALTPNQGVRIPAGEEDWIAFDEQEGTEKLWMIWAAAGVPELEKAKSFGQAEHGGAVADPHQVRAIQAFLEKHRRPEPVVEKQETQRQTVVRGAGEVVVRLLKLEHH